MWNRTSESLPPKHEHLAVVHKLSSRGEEAHEDAMWDGEFWIRLNNKGTPQEAGIEKNYYHQWRRLET